MMYITLPITNPEKYDEPIEDNNKWIMCNICNSLSGCDFLVLGIKFDTFMLIKPYEKVKCLEFEELFGFQMGCTDYDNNKIICIKKDTNPHLFNGVPPIFVFH